jgi:membrane protein DedA with SNARE-associated domain
VAAERPDEDFNPDTADAAATPLDAEQSEQAEQTEQEWWNDPSMPWKNKPGRADIACMAWIGFLGIFSLAMLPVRAWLLGAPERLPWLVALLGSRSGVTALGSVVRVGTELPFIWPVLLGAVMSIKLDWTYWWAGRLWGRGMIEVWAGQSARASRNYARVERWANKLGWLGMFVAYVPIPLPIMAVVFVLAGAHGWSVKKFLVLDFLASLTWLIIYFVFGYVVGEPAVVVLEAYAKIANYVAIGLVVVIMVMAFIRSSRQMKQSQA